MDVSDELGATGLSADEVRQRHAARNRGLVPEKHGATFELVEQRGCDANAGSTRADAPSAVAGLNPTH